MSASGFSALSESPGIQIYNCRRIADDTIVKTERSVRVGLTGDHPS
jgi:hypothetical protein